MTERDPSKPPARDYITALLFMAVLFVVSILLIVVIVPDGNQRVQLIMIVIGALGSISTGFLSYLKSEETLAKAEETHLSVNSRLDDFIRVAATNAYHEGRMAGEATGKASEETRSIRLDAGTGDARSAQNIVDAFTAEMRSTRPSPPDMAMRPGTPAESSIAPVRQISKDEPVPFNLKCPACLLKRPHTDAEFREYHAEPETEPKNNPA